MKKFGDSHMHEAEKTSPVIFRVSLNTIPLVVISPTVRALSAETIVLPERRNAVDNVATFLIIVLWGQADKHSVTLAFKKIQMTIDSNTGPQLRIISQGAIVLGSTCKTHHNCSWKSSIEYRYGSLMKSNLKFYPRY